MNGSGILLNVGSECCGSAGTRRGRRGAAENVKEGKVGLRMEREAGSG